MIRIDVPDNGTVKNLILDGVTWNPSESLKLTSAQELWWRDIKLTIVVPWDSLKAVCPDVERPLHGNGKVRLSGKCRQNLLKVNKFEIIEESDSDAGY
jgi:hypothetical protein